MADLNTPPTVLNFNDDTDRAASCLAAIQRVLREHRFKVNVSEWLIFESTHRPKNSEALFNPATTSWLDDSCNMMNDLAIHDLALERLRSPS